MPWQLDWNACRTDLSAFRQLLTDNAALSERNDILPFFRRHADLVALLGTYHPNIESFDRFGIEVHIFGKYVADVVVGDRANNALCFIEVEDARPNSVFVPSRRHGTEWSPRLERGFSQVVDWLWLLDDQQSTLSFAAEFGQRPLDVMALLVVGRDSGVSLADRPRLAWRSKYVQVAAQRVVCCTFDDVARRLQQRLLMWPEIATMQIPPPR